MIIDEQGFRLNVGTVLLGPKHCVFLAKRLGQDAWQFPQGGMHVDEDPETTLLRELQEEIGLTCNDVKILACTQEWLYYRLPKRLIRQQQPLCIGQKQKWFLLQFLGHDSKIQLDTSRSPEFDSWRWVDYWHPLKEIIPFKHEVYRKVLREFAPYVFPLSHPHDSPQDSHSSC